MTATRNRVDTELDNDHDHVSTDAATMPDDCNVRMVDAGKVMAVRAAMPADEVVSDAAEVFSLLGEPGRLRLLIALLEGGELCVCDLAATTGISETSVSHALRLLRAHRIVSVQRRGRMAYYRLDDGHVRMLLDLGLTHTQHAAGTNHRVAR